MLRREAQSPQAPLTTPLAIALSGVATIAGAIALYVAASPEPAVVVLETPRAIPLPVRIPTVALVPVPARVPAIARVDGRIEQVAAAGAAPVIAIATKDRVWVSRDDGASFEPALDGEGEVGELFVGDTGIVFARRGNRLGIAGPDAPATWIDLPALDGRVLDPRGAAIVAEQWDHGVVALSKDHTRWETIVGGGAWNALAVDANQSGAVRVLATLRKGEHHWGAPMLLVAGPHPRRVWQGNYDDEVGFLRASTPCSALAGDTLWIVQRDPEPLTTETKPSRLFVVDPDGESRAVSLPGVDLEAARVTCTIVGNLHATYAAFAIDGHAPLAFSLDAADGKATRRPGADLADLRAVDHRGRALGLRDGRLVRFSDDGDVTTLAR